MRTDRFERDRDSAQCQWKADYLANHVEIAQATLHLDNGETGDRDFSYGPVKGTRA